MSGGLFVRYLRAYLARHFDAVRVDRTGRAPELDGPVIFYSNHAAWWDPVVLLVLARAFYGERHVRAPIDAAALRRYAVLERCGLFAIEPGTIAGARRFLGVARDVLARPDGAIGVTAQGRFADVRERPVRLERGVARLLVGLPNVRAVPIALEYPFWNERRPEALIRFGLPFGAAGMTLAAAQVRVESALEAGLDALAEAAMTRDAARFDVLVGGRHAGAGLIADLPARLRAWAHGRRFDAAHGAVGREQG